MSTTLTYFYDFTPKIEATGQSHKFGRWDEWLTWPAILPSAGPASLAENGEGVRITLDYAWPEGGWRPGDTQYFDLFGKNLNLDQTGALTGTITQVEMGNIVRTPQTTVEFNMFALSGLAIEGPTFADMIEAYRTHDALLGFYDAPRAYDPRFDALLAPLDPLISEITEILGSSGSDQVLLHHTASLDRVDAGAGNDRISWYGYDAGAPVIDGGPGRDTFWITSTDDVAISLEAETAVFPDRTIQLHNIEQVTAGRGDDTLHGDAQDNSFYGGMGHDVIRGRAGDDNLLGNDYGPMDGAEGDNDTLFGGRGDDQLVPRFGHDRVFGGRGADFIEIGSGRDTLTGGPGADLFGFNVKVSRGGLDVITDFGRGADRLDLRFFGDIETLADLKARADHTEAGTLLTAAPGHRVLLADLEPEDLAAEMFLF